MTQSHPTLGSAHVLERTPAQQSDRDFLQRALEGERARFLILAAGKPVIQSNAERTDVRIRWFSRAELALMEIDPSGALFLGLTPLAGEPRFALSLSSDLCIGLEALLTPAVDLRSLATEGVMSEQEISLLGQAKALADWHGASGHCSRCGSLSQPIDGGWRRLCPACGTQAFPRVEPVVIMLITDGPRAVLARQGHFPVGMYSLPAGFLEPGEDIENAVRRETREETGLTVGAVSYQLSQPWPFPHSLMIGCLAEASTTEIRPDAAELEDARWFTMDEVRSMLEGKHPEGLWVPGAQAIAHALIRRWLAM